MSKGWDDVEGHQACRTASRGRINLKPVDGFRVQVLEVED